ncbi:MAG TPA: nitrogenase component 1 [Methanospirillum sp.]|uniref:nitrogenase component 1 n=1 Tax=Methanospirillum sp. TaxID=45200 RepID=UPI002CCA2CC5|nr:nitrogenase component 1 [Methanospirillum sp.]HWQ63380.1 nitrogenase component 1 [Methanospirillum sp.]
MVSIKIAVYGKGGIGKSTISANLSAALSEKGDRVLQIGCDPKYDSTRLLLGGRIPITVLQYIKTVLPEDRKAEDIVFQGFGNVACVEAGGPEPGVGCAGRGIITTFDLLDDLGIRPSLFDITLYDVLGDVVCGGFAVPIRSEYADAVYIITSGEYLSLYAANNILRGIRNFTAKKGRIAGIIYNARGGVEEEDRVNRFADAVSLPIIARIPRSNIFAAAEERGCTLIEGYPDSIEAALLRNLSDHAEGIRTDATNLLHQARPLTDEDLERVVLLRGDISLAKRYSGVLKDRNTSVKCKSSAVKNKRPLIGCAFAGAVSVTAQVTDAATVMHCPRSCALMIHEKLMDTSQVSAIRFDHPYRTESPGRLITTDMTDEDFVFGGEDKLRRTIEETIQRGYQTIFVVTACPPGIIGDDTLKVAAELMDIHSGINIIPVPVDGNLVGDFAQGVIDAHKAVTRLIRPQSNKSERSVNIIAEKWLASNPEKNINDIRLLLKKLGISINCRFLLKTETKSLTNFNEACLNLPAERDDTVKSIQQLIASVSDLPFLDLPLPTGFTDTSEWLLAVSRIFGDEAKAEKIIADEEIIYRREIAALKPELNGKTILIFTYPKNLDWVCDIAHDLEMKILKVGLVYSPFAETFTTRYTDQFPIEHNYSLEKRADDIQNLEPDLVLVTYPALKPHERARSGNIPYCPGFGFHAGIEHADQWARLMKAPIVESWKDDGEGIV